ncbi:hypothetical protein FRB99_001715 [Tulasnella sp. 403]|nr:hypothetical protein FRB99_001715 [Tulasnella sp. 403]
MDAAPPSTSEPASVPPLVPVPDTAGPSSIGNLNLPPGTTPEQLAQLRALLQSMGARGSGAGARRAAFTEPDLSLSDVLTPTNLQPLLDNPTLLSAVFPSLPSDLPVKPSPETIRKIVESPPFQASVRQLDQALATGLLQELMVNLGLPPEAGTGVGPFLKAISDQAKKQRKPEGGDALMPPVLGTGPPTDEEIEYYYSPMFSWETVKDQVDSGDLGNLKRHPVMQQRYDAWINEQVKVYGSIVKYLVNVRLGWGPTETRPATPESHANPTYTDPSGRTTGPTLDLPTPPPTRPFTPSGFEPQYFTADIPEKYVKILKNDWPYSIPVNVKHFVVWTRVPIIHPAIVPTKIWARIERDGLWGFTGSDRVAEPKVIPGEESGDDVLELVRRAHVEMHKYVLANWPEEEWETAWFVNPPVRVMLQYAPHWWLMFGMFDMCSVFKVFLV